MHSIGSISARRTSMARPAVVALVDDGDQVVGRHVGQLVEPDW